MVILKPKIPKTKKKIQTGQSNSNTLQLLCLESFLTQKKVGFKKEVLANTLFETTRKFRFDYYCESLKAVIEVNGGEWIGGRHNSGKGYQTDLEKSNLANLNGITYLQYTYSQLKKKAYEKDIKFLLSK